MGRDSSSSIKKPGRTRGRGEAGGRRAGSLEAAGKVAWGRKRRGGGDVLLVAAVAARSFDFLLFLVRLRFRFR